VTEAATTPGIGRLTKLLPIAVIAAAVCLFASELMTLFEFIPPGGEAQCALDNGDRHSNAQMVVAAFAILGTVVAVYGRSRPAAFAVAGMGVLGLLIFLLADLRFANTAGSLSESCSGTGGFLFEAEAVPQGGFYLELVGALALAVTGIALATLTPDQLGALRLSRRARPTDAPGDDGPTTGSSASRAGSPDDEKRGLSRLGRRPRARQRG
jgi:hypothetical protein